MNETRRARLAIYGLALLAPAVTLLVRWPLAVVLGDRVMYMVFFPAIVIVAYFGGFWPGLLATVLSAVSATYFLVHPLHFEITTVPDAIALILLVLIGTMISILSESLHRTRRRLLANQRQQAEEARRETEERFRQLAENIHEIFWLMDPSDDRIIYLSPGYEAVWGRPRQAVLEQPLTWVESIHADDRDRAIERMEQFKHGVFTDDEFRVVRPDGSVRWVRSRPFPIKDANGNVSRIAGLVENITERKQAEEALRESEHRWRSLTETLPQLVWAATPDGACDYFSTQWTQYTGVPEIHLLGWQWMETLHPDDREPTRQFWTNSVAGRGPYDVEYRVRRSDGEYRWFKTRGTPIRDSAGGIGKWFGTCTDITDGKLAAEELRLARDAAESANRAKDEFLANVSHEIRTPMNAILGMTELVLDTPLSEDQRQSLKTVKAAADNLLSIINDLLDFSKIEAGKLELEPADFSLRAALGDTLRTLAMRAHNKGLELVSQVQPDVPDALVGDTGRLRQVLLNLVGNAVKFTDAGEVVVEVKSEIRNPKSPQENPKSEIRNPKQIQITKEENRKPESAAVLNLGDSDFGIVSDRISDDLTDVSLHFEVRDTGIGIPPDKQQKIFRAFEQEDTSTTRKYGGTGLGLTIAARLVALMGGTIAVHSEPGRGSTFTFTAPFGRQPHSRRTDRQSVPPSVVLDSLPVLIVDDNATNRHILEEWLRIWQMEPVSVGDGAAAMDTLGDTAAHGRPYPLVLLDARMPDTDGLELAARIRKRAELSATRIILLTSGNIPCDAARLRELRIDAHLLKPVQQDELRQTIYRVMSRAARVASDESRMAREEQSGEGRSDSASSLAPRPASLAPHPSSLATPLHILVAEDNDFNAQLLEQLLVRRGHHVRLANNGRDALSLVGICPLTPEFDLLLLDIHMPELDGFQVIHAIRERERAAGGHLPVIALTARSRKEDREQCLAAGMDDFLAKPIQAADLWAAMDRVVAPPGRSPETGVSSRRPEHDSLLTPDSCLLTPGYGLLDGRVLLAACGGDAGILESICQAFRAGLPDHVTAIQDALRAGDVVRLRNAAHKLCGMVAAFSTVAGGVVSRLEDHAAQGQLDEARPLAARLETMAQELIRAVDGLSLEKLQMFLASMH